MTGAVLRQIPGEGDPIPPLPSLGQALAALYAALHDDLESPARMALENAEDGDMPETVAAGLLALAMDGEALHRMIQAMDDMVEYHAPNGYRRRLGPPPVAPDLVAAVRRAGRRWTMVASGIDALFAGAEQDAAECERALIELETGRARVTEDGAAIVAGGAVPGGRGKPGRAP